VGALAVPHLSVAERVAGGKAARAEVPRSHNAVCEPSPDRVDPVRIARRAGRDARPSPDNGYWTEDAARIVLDTLGRDRTAMA
jgi:hypothetical protein